MFRISNFQLYCLLMMLIGPVAFLETPKIIILRLGSAAWLLTLAVIIPGILLAFMFQYIIGKSRSPFPLLLEEHLGKIAGKILGILYILVFLLVCSYTLRLFVDFIVTNVLPQTPISVFIGVLLLVGLVAIKSGLENLARCCELLIILGLPFAILIFIVAIIENWNPMSLLPLSQINPKSFFLGLYTCNSSLGKMLPILALAFFAPCREKVRPLMFISVLSFAFLLLITTISALMSLDVGLAVLATFPTFSTVRLLHIADFIQNIDIVFIGIWVTAIFASLSILWFMACYSAQQLFDLKDYRFIAAPSSLIIGSFSILMSKNILELQAIGIHIIPFLYSLIFILVPLLLFLITLFKPYPEADSEACEQNKVTAGA